MPLAVYAMMGCSTAESRAELLSDIAALPRHKAIALAAALDTETVKCDKILRYSCNRNKSVLILQRQFAQLRHADVSMLSTSLDAREHVSEGAAFPTRNAQLNEIEMQRP